MTLPNIKKYFKDNGIPKKEIQINGYTLIKTPEKFIETHTRALEMNPKNKL